MNSAGRAMLISFVPRTTIAFNPLSPMTAPMPSRLALDLPCSMEAKIDPVFTGQADGRHLGFRLLQLLADEFCGFTGTFSPQMRGIAYFYLVVVYPEVDQRRGTCRE